MIVYVFRQANYINKLWFGNRFIVLKHFDIDLWQFDPNTWYAVEVPVQAFKQEGYTQNHVIAQKSFFEWKHCDLDF